MEARTNTGGDDLLEPSPYDSDEQHLIGKDPRTVPTDQLSARGYAQPMKAIRQHCIDCCGGVLSEVRKCTATGCALWHLRMGKNVLRGAGSA